MGAPELNNLLGIAIVAFLAPLLLGFVPWLRLPAVVLEIVAGIAIGPSGLGWVELDAAAGTVALLGLAFLLFLAGLEINFSLLRGRVLRVALTGFALSLALALALGGALRGLGLAESPLLVGVILASTALGVVIPVLSDANESTSPFGQLVIAGAAIADFGAILLLSLLFSGEGGGTTARIALLVAFAASLLAVALAVYGAERDRALSHVLQRLQDTTAQIRVRGCVVLLVALAVIAEQFGLEAILGAFAAGALLVVLDRDEHMTHPELRVKLEAIGFGFLIPAFFVASGIRFDLDALVSDGSALALVPLLLLALAVARGVPALLLYRSVIGERQARIAALLQATSLPFIVTAVQIGEERGLLAPATGAALIAAGLLSVLLFPAGALSLLRGGAPQAQPAAA